MWGEEEGSNGSSPRVRGTDPSAPRYVLDVRFIPACAGNRHAKPISTHWAAVHPRVCGEQVTSNRDGGAVTGSSPRVRGTGGTGGNVVINLRFIPACAGNSSRARESRRSGTVHPRVCGEQAGQAVTSSSTCGSSPRVRGTAPGQESRGGRGRFIPACAGNSLLASSTTPMPPVHPRVCGEQSRESPRRPPPHGSSPRVRGTDTTPPPPRQRSRFIPACAGNRDTGLHSLYCLAVHPRVCGEQTVDNRRCFASDGSSPRVRGTVFLNEPEASLARFIPACAGNRLRRCYSHKPITVHPRVCGEQSIGIIS